MIKTYTQLKSGTYCYIRLAKYHDIYKKVMPQVLLDRMEIISEYTGYMQIHLINASLEEHIRSSPKKLQLG